MNLETKLTKSKLGLAEELGYVSRAYKYLGYSRDTFYYNGLVLGKITIN